VVVRDFQMESFPKLDGESRNLLEIAATAGNQRDGTHNATRRDPKIVRRTPDFLLSPCIEQVRISTNGIDDDLDEIGAIDYSRLRIKATRRMRKGLPTW
jgi:hypothetical protein